MHKQELDMKDAKSAFNSFFSMDPLRANENAPVPGIDPVAHVMNQIKEVQTPTGKKSITKVDASKGGGDKSQVTSMSVDEAEAIVNTDKSFKEILKELNVSFSSLFSIIDCILSEGHYEEEHDIKGMRFAFKTKRLQAIDAINDLLDGAKYVMPGTTGHFLLEHSLAASLVRFKLRNKPERVFAHETPEDDAAVLDFIRKELSSPVYGILATKFNRFELMVGLASRDEAIEHFLAHTQG